MSGERTCSVCGRPERIASAKPRPPASAWVCWTVPDGAGSSFANDAEAQRCSWLGYERVCRELRESLAPMSCGHPGACVVSDEEGTSHCGWCAAIEAERRTEEMAG